MRKPRLLFVNPRNSSAVEESLGVGHDTKLELVSIRLVRTRRRLKEPDISSCEKCLPIGTLKNWTQYSIEAPQPSYLKTLDELIFLKLGCRVDRNIGMRTRENLPTAAANLIKRTKSRQHKKNAPP